MPVDALLPEHFTLAVKRDGCGADRQLLAEPLDALDDGAAAANGSNCSALFQSGHDATQSVGVER